MASPDPPSVATLGTPAMEALLLDAGNTVVFLDHAAVARIARDHGVAVTAEGLAAVEGEAKRRNEALLVGGGSHEDGWGAYFVALFGAAGVDAATARALLPALRAEHDRLNLWRRVPEGLPEALARARAAGLRLGVVSNSEGRLPELFDAVGLGEAFEIVVDSANEGVRKPDPRIFERAVARLGVAPERALYAGDLPQVDVTGALAAGLRAALVDPLGFYPDHTGSPRYASVEALVDDLLSPGPRGGSL